MKNLSVLILILLSTSVLAQPYNDSSKTKMVDLNQLVGTWQGDGWTQQGKIRHEFNQTEVVQYKLDGSVLQIEGKGYAGDSLIFQAMAIISYNNKDNNYRFNSFLADGRYTEAIGVFNSDGSFDWQFKVPNGGTIKYHIVFNDTTWQEKGFYSPDDGEQWFPFLEMNLIKI